MSTSHGRHGAKRQQTVALSEVQSENARWWADTPMTYDWWEGSAVDGLPELGWFDDQDNRAIATHRHFADYHKHFDRVIPFAELAGKQVLEIGVGSGLHSELMARAGARLTGIDITQQAVELTKRRFALKGIEGDFAVWDAEQDREEFSRRFDYIWSWGVIHHSSRTARIVRNVSQWLKADGRFGGMVYHRDSMQFVIALLREWVVKRNPSASVDEALWRHADGFSARFYPADLWRDLLLGFFEEANTSVSGSDGDIAPLPGAVAQHVVPRIPPRLKVRIVSRTGGWLIFDARYPLCSR